MHAGGRTRFETPYLYSEVDKALSKIICTRKTVGSLMSYNASDDNVRAEIHARTYDNGFRVVRQTEYRFNSANNRFTVFFAR